MQISVDSTELIKELKLPPLFNENRLRYPEELRSEKWILIELQGTLTVTGGLNDLSGLSLGEVEFTTEGKVTLTMERHRLVGTLVKLAKPMVILSRENLDTDENALSTQKSQYVLSCVIRYKCLFNQMPKYNLSEKYQGITF